MATRVPDAPHRLAHEVVGFVHRLRAADLTKVPGRRRDARLGGRAPVARRRGAVAGRRRRDAGRRPQVRGGHPPGARRGRPPVPRRGDRPGELSPMTDARPRAIPVLAPTGEADRRPPAARRGRRVRARAARRRAAGRHGGLDRLRPGPDPGRHRQPRDRARRGRRRCSCGGATTARSTTACSPSSGGAAAASCRRPHRGPDARRRPRRGRRARRVRRGRRGPRGLDVGARDDGHPGRHGRGGRRRDRGRDHLARRVLRGRDPPPPGLRPDDLGRAARCRAVRGPAPTRASSAGGPVASSSTRTAVAWPSGRCSARTWPRAS